MIGESLLLQSKNTSNNPMKIACIKKLQIGVVSLAVISCQNTPSEPQISAADDQATKLEAVSSDESQESVRISTKIIEIIRPLDSPDIPTKRYERKLSEGEYQILMRQIAQQKGVDILTIPSVITPHGKEAKIEIVKDFIYPVDPENQTKTKLEKIGVIANHTSQRVNDHKISIKSSVQVCELEGFEEKQGNFSSPIFIRRNVKSFAKLKDGETLLIGGITDKSTRTCEDQTSEDQYSVFTPKVVSEEQLSRELLIVVTARRINPDGSWR